MLSSFGLIRGATIYPSYRFVNGNTATRRGGSSEGGPGYFSQYTATGSSPSALSSLRQTKTAGRRSPERSTMLKTWTASESGCRSRTSASVSDSEGESRSFTGRGDAEAGAKADGLPLGSRAGALKELRSMERSPRRSRVRHAAEYVRRLTSRRRGLCVELRTRRRRRQSRESRQFGASIEIWEKRRDQ